MRSARNTFDNISISRNETYMGSITGEYSLPRTSVTTMHIRHARRVCIATFYFAIDVEGLHDLYLSCVMNVEMEYSRNTHVERLHCNELDSR